MTEIKLCKLLDFLDEKILDVRRNDTMPFMAKITAYNLIIDLQEFIKNELEEQVAELKKQDCDRAKYL